MAVPIFSLNLKQSILPRLVSIGKYDGNYCCLTVATAADKILIHNPHNRLFLGKLDEDTSKEVNTLNVNQTVTSLCCGKLKPSEDRDVLVIGIGSNLLGFDIDTNSDLFYKEVPDGTSSIIVGRLGKSEIPMAIVGGNCSLQGFDSTGTSIYWTVTGDNVSSLALLDYDQDGYNELIVGSEDYEIRVFKDDNILNEIRETEAVTSLAAFQGNCFAYGLENCTVGVYEKQQRLWRVKSKNKAMAILSYDLDGDGVEELITGWSNGKLDARSSRTGEVLLKDYLGACIAGLVEGDYREIGKNDLICCSVDGEIRGYNLSRQMSVRENSKNHFEKRRDQDVVRELLIKKQALLLEFRNYEENGKYASSTVDEIRPELAPSSTRVGIIPAKTRLQTGISVSSGDELTKPHVVVALATNNDTLVRVVLVFAEGIFEGETYVSHPTDDACSSNLEVALNPPHDVTVDIHIKALVGYRGSEHYHVFELTRQLPRFSMYIVITNEEIDPLILPGLFIRLNERIQRIVMWINQNFILSNDLSVTNDLIVTFLSLRDNTKLNIIMSMSGELYLLTPNIVLAGDLIQSLVEFLNVSQLQVKANFPFEEEKICKLLEQVNELQEVKIRLNAEMADYSGLIPKYLLRAEDSRLLRDVENVRKWYSDLSEINKDLIMNYNIRYNNHKEIMNVLKEINVIIQRSARLRAGKYKTQIVNLSRQALKSNNVISLISIMKTGEI